jgi:hypothetical protein
MKEFSDMKHREENVRSFTIILDVFGWCRIAFSRNSSIIFWLVSKYKIKIENNNRILLIR